MHEAIIAETGGIAGLRDATMLHSGVARPFAIFGGVEMYPTDFTKAGALLHSLIKSHPFMDGPKRTAFVATLYFLARCGYAIPERFSIDEVIEFCVSLAEENLLQARGENIRPKTIAEMAVWLQKLLSERANP